MIIRVKQLIEWEKHSRAGIDFVIPGGGKVNVFD